MTRFPPGVPPGVPDPFPHVKRAYISADEHIERWVNGDAVHRLFKRPITDATGAVLAESECEECTPDFGCCRPELLALPQIRRAYAAAAHRERMRFLSLFLNALLVVVAPGKKAFVIDHGAQS